PVARKEGVSSIESRRTAPQGGTGAGCVSRCPPRPVAAGPAAVPASPSLQPPGPPPLGLLLRLRQLAGPPFFVGVGPRAASGLVGSSTPSANCSTSTPSAPASRLTGRRPGPWRRRSAARRRGRRGAG